MMASEICNTNSSSVNQAAQISYNGPVYFNVSQQQLESEFQNKLNIKGENYLIYFNKIEQVPQRTDKTTFNIPFRLPHPRNRAFFGRAEELRRIYKYFKDAQSTTEEDSFNEELPTLVLVGTGGMGKTQIALEYAYRHHSEYSAVFWMNATSEETILAAFIDTLQRIIKEQVRLSGPDPDYTSVALKLGLQGLINSKGLINNDPSSAYEIQMALFSWLELPENDKWLIILDNADDLETFNIEQYIPNRGGSLLITSRRPDFSHYAEQLDLEGLDLESAVNLILSLTRSRKTEDIKEQAKALVEKLGLMPLAITQAGCYIHETKASIEDYMNFYDKAFMIAQSKKPRFGWNYRHDTATTTWEISFSQVEKQDTEAASILLTASYFNPQEIFEKLWIHDPSDEDSEQQILEASLSVKNRVLLLSSYSLVKIIRLGVFSIHPVVHSWARERLKPQERFDAVVNALNIIGKACNWKKVDRRGGDWDGLEERRIMAHIDRLDRLIEPVYHQLLQQESETKNLWAYATTIGRVAFNQGKVNQATQWFKRALNGQETNLGSDHVATFNTMDAIALVYVTQGDHERAVEWYTRTLKGKEKLFGEGHINTLSNLNNMAIAFKSLKEYDKAMSYFQRSYHGHRREFGEDDPQTLTNIHNIGMLLSTQGKWEEASQWLLRALKGGEKILGENHPSTLLAVHELGLVRRNQSRYQEALELCQRVFQAREMVLGKYHPDTLDTAYEVGYTLADLGRYEEALEKFKAVFTAGEKALGKEHRITLLAMFEIGWVLAKQNRNEEALQWYKRTLALRERVLGENHLDTLAAAKEIAGLLGMQRDTPIDAPIQMYKRVLAGRKRVLGDDSVMTIDVLHSIGYAYGERGMYEDAVRWTKRALAARVKVLGKDHLNTHETAHNLAIELTKQGKFDDGIAWYESAVDIRKKVLGEDHPLVLNTIHCLELVRNAWSAEYAST